MRDLGAERGLERLLSRVLDPETGLIRFIAEVPVQPDEALIHLAVAEFQNPFALPPMAEMLRGEDPGVVRMGTGAGLDRLSALWSTVGETIERYALNVYDKDEIRWGRIGETADTYVSPDAFILFSPEQHSTEGFKFSRFDPSRPLGWTPAFRLMDGGSAMLPAPLAIFRYQHRWEHERLDAGYSTGGAAGPTLEAAWHSGLLEVIERDGFACHWYLRRTPAEIDVAEHAASLSAKLLRTLERAPLKLKFFDITTDLGVPSVLAIGLPRSGGVAIGASARPTLGAAMEKAAIEAFHTHNWVLDLQRNRARIDLPSEIRDYSDHVVYHLDRSRHGAMEFLFQGGGQALPNQPYAGRDDATKLSTLVGRLAENGLQSYAIDITPPEVEGLNIFVGRSFVPGLHPLGSGSGNEHLDRRRLDRFAARAGMAAPTSLNIAPHPFP